MVFLSLLCSTTSCVWRWGGNDLYVVLALSSNCLIVIFLMSYSLQFLSDLVVEGRLALYAELVSFVSFLDNLLIWLPLIFNWWPWNVSWLEQQCDLNVINVTFMLVFIWGCFPEVKHFSDINNSSVSFMSLFEKWFCQFLDTFVFHVSFVSHLRTFLSVLCHISVFENLIIF